eukprot:c4751_g1_i1.p1 GENE.c4751_g1_i1~~c4751_g1_i1.p1  ORF type:complete len:256 (-),score=85.94 c4751_g1_i1:77-844(-)
MELLKSSGNAPPPDPKKSGNSKTKSRGPPSAPTTTPAPPPPPSHTASPIQTPSPRPSPTHTAFPRPTPPSPSRAPSNQVSPSHSPSLGPVPGTHPQLVLQPLGAPQPQAQTRMSRSQKTAMKRKEEEEVQQILKDENLDQIDEKLSELVSLTEQPRDDDVMMFAVPMCGPYIAMQSFRFKVKLTPGNLKRGKAVKLANEVLFRQSNLIPRCRELIKSIGDQELTEVMLGNVKLAVPGINNVKGAGKAKGKKRSEE